MEYWSKFLHTYIAMIFASSHLSSLPAHSPQCQQYRESTSVLENQPAGTFVLQVHAVDADEGSNGRVTYGFMHKDSTVPAFSIHPDTGTKTHTYSLSLPQTYTYRRIHNFYSSGDSYAGLFPLSITYHVVTWGYSVRRHAGCQHVQVHNLKTE